MLGSETSAVVLLGSERTNRAFLVNTLLETTPYQDQDDQTPVASPHSSCNSSGGSEGSGGRSSGGGDGRSFTPPEELLEFPSWSGTEKLIFDETIGSDFHVDWARENQLARETRVGPNGEYVVKHANAFLLSQNSPFVTYLRFKRVPELYIHFMSEEQLRQRYQDLLKGAAPLPPSDVHFLRSTISWCTDEMQDAAVESAFRSYRNGNEVPIKKDVAAILGNLVRYCGNGASLDADRVYIRTKLHAVRDTFSYLMDSVYIGYPSTFLSGLKYFAVCSPRHLLCSQVVDTASLLLLATSDGNVDANVARVLSQSSFLFNFSSSAEAKGFALVNMMENVVRASGVDPHGGAAMSAGIEGYLKQPAVVASRKERALQSKRQIFALLKSSPSLCTMPAVQIDRVVSRVDVHFVDICGHLLAFRERRESEWTGIHGLCCMIENYAVAQCGQRLQKFSRSWISRRNPKSGRKFVLVGKGKPPKEPPSAVPGSTGRLDDAPGKSAAADDGVDTLIAQLSTDLLFGASGDDRKYLPTESSIVASLSNNLNSWKTFFSAATLTQSSPIRERLTVVFRSAASTIPEGFKVVPRDENIALSCAAGDGANSSSSSSSSLDILAALSTSLLQSLPQTEEQERVTARCWSELEQRLAENWAEIWNDEVIAPLSRKERDLHVIVQSTFSSLVSLLTSSGCIDDAKREALLAMQNKLASTIVGTLSHVQTCLRQVDLRHAVRETLKKYSALSPLRIQKLKHFLIPLYRDAINETTARLGELLCAASLPDVVKLLKEVTDTASISLVAKGSTLVGAANARFLKSYSPSSSTLSTIAKEWVVFDKSKARGSHAGVAAPDFSALSPRVRAFCDVLGGGGGGDDDDDDNSNGGNNNKDSNNSDGTNGSDGNNGNNGNDGNDSNDTAMGEVPSDAFEKQLQASFLCATEITDDANSQFRALAQLLNLNEEGYPVVRLFIMNEMLANPEHYEQFFDSSEHFQQYVHRLLSESVRGDFLTLLAFVNSTMFALAVLSPRLPTPLLVVPAAVGDVTAGAGDTATAGEIAERVRVPFFAIAVVDGAIQPLSQTPQSAGGKRLSEGGTDASVSKRRNSTVQDVPMEESRLGEKPDADEPLLDPAAASADRLVGSLLSDERARLKPLNAAQFDALVGALREFRPIDGLDFDKVLLALLKGVLQQRSAGVLDAITLSGCGVLTSFTCRAIVDAFSEADFAACFPAGVSRAPPVHGVRKIDLSQSPHLSDEGVLALLRGLGGLETLVLDDCPLLSDQALLALTDEDKARLALTALSMNRCARLTNAGVLALAGVRTLRALSVAGCKLVTSAGLEQHRGLASLNVSHCSGMDGAFFAGLAQRHPHLRELRAAAATAPDSAIADALAQLPELEALELGNTALGLRGLADAMALPKLARLSVANCKGVTRSAWTLAADRVRAERGAAGLLPSLAALDVAGCVEMSGDTLAATLAEGGRDSGSGSGTLTSLKLARVETDDGALVRLLRGAGALGVFDVSGCGKKVGDGAAAELGARAGGALQKVSFAHTALSDAGLAALGARCPHITFLSCASTRVTSAGLVAATRGCAAIATLVLDSLDLDDEAVFFISSNCPRLANLSISHNKRVTDRAIKALAGINGTFLAELVSRNELAVEEAATHLKGPLPLRTLDVSYTKVTAIGFSLCLSYFPKLASLAANGLQLSSEVNLLSSAQYALTSLSLGWNSLLTDIFLISVAPFLPALRVLVLSHCPLVTDAALRHVFGRCDLRQLHIRGCKGISEKGVRDVSASKRAVVIR